MSTEEARSIVLDRISDLQRELSRCESFSSKRTILQNLDAARQMLVYLHLIEHGFRPKFKICVEPSIVQVSEPVLA